MFGGKVCIITSFQLMAATFDSVAIPRASTKKCHHLDDCLDDLLNHGNWESSSALNLNLNNPYSRFKIV